MQRMSDMLTRWLDGNLRQNHANDSTGSQSEPVQGAEASQEPSQEVAGSQSIPSVQTVSASNASVNETLPFQLNVDNNVAEISTSESETPSVYMDVAEDYEPCSRPEGNSAIENISNSDRQIDTDTSEAVQPLDQSVLPGPIGYKDVFSPDSNKDSSDTKSDESQSSFVRKIASMEMDDCENIKQRDIEAIGDSSSEYFSDNTEDSNRVQNDSKSLPYNPLFPTVYEENIEKSITDAEQSDNKNDCDIMYSVNEASSKTTNENEIESNFELDKTESMTCDTACDTDNEKVASETGQHISNDAETIVTKETVTQSERGTSTEQSQCAESSTQTAFDDSTLTLAAEQTMIRQTMEAAVETLRERNLEPVISLHYSSESTTNSTITLGFVNYGDLQDPSSVTVTESPVISSQSGVSLPMAPVTLGPASELPASENSVNSVQEKQTVEETTADPASTSNNEIRGEKANVKTPDCETSHTSNNLNPLNRVEICNSNKIEHENLPDIVAESSQGSILSKSDETHVHNRSDILNDNSVSIQSEGSSNHGEMNDQRDSCDESEVIGNDDLNTDDMLHSGIIVTASDNEKNGNPDTSTSSEAVLPQQRNSDHKTENESNSHETPTFSIPDVAINDSQTDLDNVEGTDRVTDSVMDNDDNSSDFDRVLDEVLGSSDTDSQPAREERLEAVRRHRVDQLMSGTGEYR